MDARQHSVDPHRALVRAAGSAPGGAGPTGTGQCGGSSACSCESETISGPGGPILLLRGAGEIDLHSLPVLRDALHAAIDQRPADLVVDLIAVGFCCVRAGDLLATAGTTAQADRTSFSLSGLPPHLTLLSALLRPEGSFLRYRSAAAAVTALQSSRFTGPPEQRQLLSCGAAAFGEDVADDAAAPAEQG